MDKEGKKLLLVAVSVGVFFLVTITAAILVVTPKAGAQRPEFIASHSITAAAANATAGRVQPVSENTEDNQTQVVINNAIEANIYNNMEAPDTTAEAAVNDGDRRTFQVQVNSPETAGVPHTPEIAPLPASRPTAVVTVKPAEPVKPAAPAAAVKPAAAKKPAAAPSKPAVAPKPAQAKTINDYWVQTGAFVAKVRAEDAKETLASKGITSIIENRQVDGKTWYRVRLGPYTSEEEANYWRKLVVAIDGFGESQVRQTIRQQ